MHLKVLETIFMLGKSFSNKRVGAPRLLVYGPNCSIDLASILETTEDGYGRTLGSF